jgi:hypothetical protein
MLRQPVPTETILEVSHPMGTGVDPVLTTR